jgi:uncharacterized protein (TIGR02145 family)
MSMKKLIKKPIDGLFRLLKISAGMSLSILTITTISTAQIDIAQGKNVVATSQQNDNGVVRFATYAVDGNETTRWSSAYTDNQSITIDLGGFYQVTGVSISWEFASARDYTIDTSSNGVTYDIMAERFAMSGGANRVDNIPCSGVTRYIRMSGKVRSSAFGYSIFSFKVFGTPLNYLTYTVNFKTFEGHAVTAATVFNGNKIIKPENPTHSGGFTFDGWYKEPECKEPYDFNSRVISSIELYAKWVIADIQGNTYRVVKIGNQYWTTENLRTIRYADDTQINQITDYEAWRFATTAAYCWYDNDESKKLHGAIYNWAVITSNKLAPSGWRVATASDWTALQNYLIANGYNHDGTRTGNKIAKSMSDKSGWLPVNTSGTPGNSPIDNNKSYFSATPNGYRTFWDGRFTDWNNAGSWWAAGTSPVEIEIRSRNANMIMQNPGSNYGAYVRLVKN